MWREESLEVYGISYNCRMKVYEEASKKGINGGKIRKFVLKSAGRIVENYDRGWDVEPADPNTQLAVDILLHTNNY